MNKPPVRWGILGAAEIARKNWQAIRNSGNGIIAAVASRDLDRARQFIADCQRQVAFDKAPEAVAGYAALLARPDIDAVYIPLPTGLRREWVLQAAAAGKAVVCEKPCAVNLAELREMTDACRRHQVQFMDGVMFSHSRRLRRMIEVVQDESTLGDIRRLTSGFSFHAPPAFFNGNIRAHSTLEPQGCVGDLGWYCLRLTLHLLKGRRPRQVSGRILSELGRSDSPAPVPTEFSGEVLFDGGISASFYCSFITELQQWAHISGSRGSLQLDDFVLPHYGEESRFRVSQPAFQVDGCTFIMEPHQRTEAVAEYSNNHPTAQETNLFRSFAAQIQCGTLNPDWPDIALKTQELMDACLLSARQESRLISIPDGSD